jgi:hypothetical protein
VPAIDWALAWRNDAQGWLYARWEGQAMVRTVVLLLRMLGRAIG